MKKTHIAAMVSVAAVAMLGAVYAYAAPSARQWTFAGPNFLLTSATPQEVEHAIDRTWLALRGPDHGSLVKHMSHSDGGGTSVWQSAGTFKAADGGTCRVEAIGHGGAEAVVSFEVDGGRGDTLPLLNASTADLQNQGFRQRR